MSNLIIKDSGNNELPYERLASYGAQSLTDSELLAILLRTGTSGCNVLEVANSLLGGRYASDGIAMLLRVTYEELIEIKGIGKVKAIQILALSELIKRVWRSESGNGCSLDSAEGCALYYTQEMRHLEREELRIAFLDLRFRLISDLMISRGTIDSSLVSVRDILIEALRRRAVNIILIHNHPTGSPAPSIADIEVTDKVKAGCTSVGISLIDHIIIGGNDYYSFREHGNIV